MTVQDIARNLDAEFSIEYRSGGAHVPPEHVESFMQSLLRRNRNVFPSSSLIDTAKPAMDFHTALTLLTIAVESRNESLIWQPMPEGHGPAPGRQQLRLVDLCERLLPWFKQIGQWKKIAETATNERDDMRQRRDKAIEEANEYYRELQIAGLRPWPSDEED